MPKRGKRSTVPQGFRPSLTGSSFQAVGPPSLDNAVSRRAKKRAERAAKKAQEVEKLKDSVCRAQRPSLGATEQVLLIQGNRLFNVGDFTGAARLYNEAIVSFGAKPLLLSNLSAAYLKLEMYAFIL